MEFHPRDRQLTIREGVVGTEADTTPGTNFSGSFGTKCRHTGEACKINPLSAWFTEGETIKYADNSAYLKARQEYKQTYANAIAHMDAYVQSCKDDFNKKGSAEDVKWFWLEQSEYQKELANQRILDEKLQSEIMIAGGSFERYYSQTLANPDVIESAALATDQRRLGDSLSDKWAERSRKVCELWK